MAFAANEFVMKTRLSGNAYYGNKTIIDVCYINNTTENTKDKVPNSIFSDDIFECN